MGERLKAIVRDCIYLFVNYFIAYIPVWHVRKLLYLALGMKIGKGSRICMKCTIMSPWNIQIGKNTMVNEHALLDGRGGLQIGDSCSISMWAIVYSASHYLDSEVFQYYAKQTRLENCIWLGVRSVVLPGSHLQDFTVIGANGVYKGTTEPRAVLSGNPAIKVRERNVEKPYDLEIHQFFR